MKNYSLQLLIAIDQLLNAVIGGSADETISARAWRENPESFSTKAIDWLFRFSGEDHCYQAYLEEKNRIQLPESYRDLKM